MSSVTDKVRALVPRAVQHGLRARLSPFRVRLLAAPVGGVEVAVAHGTGSAVVLVRLGLVRGSRQPKARAWRGARTFHGMGDAACGRTVERNQDE